MLNLNKNKRNSSLKGIALILALVTMLAMCLVGCTDQEARDAAQEAKDKAAAAVTTTQLNDAIANALKGVETVTLEEVNTAITKALEGYAKVADLEILTKAQVEEIVNAATSKIKSCTCTGVQSCTCEVKTKAEINALIAAAGANVTAALEAKANELQGQITSNNESVAAQLATINANISKVDAAVLAAVKDLAEVKENLEANYATKEALKAATDAIAALESELGTSVGDASSALEAKISSSVEAAKKELNDALEGLKNELAAHSKQWNDNTPEVIKLCAELNKILTTNDYKFNDVVYKFANNKKWYGNQWAELEAIVDGARIELIRSYNAENCLEDVLDRLSAFKTIVDMDGDLEAAANLVPFPVSLDDKATVVKANADYKAAFDALVADFGLTLVEEYVDTADTFEANPEMLKYGTDKIALLETALEDVDGLIEEYAVNSLEVVYGKYVDVLDDKNNVIGQEWVVTMTEDDAGMIKHIIEDRLVNVGSDDTAELADITAAYNEFLGSECKLNPEAKAVIVAKGQDAAAILAADTYMNVADAYEGDTNTLFVYFYPVVDVYSARCYEENFKALKAAMSVNDVLGYMHELVDANLADEKALTDIGTAFANVINDYVMWKLDNADAYTFAGSKHYLTFAPNTGKILSVVKENGNDKLVEVEYNFYPDGTNGLGWAKMIEMVKAHFNLIVNAEKAVVNFSGYNEVIEGYLTATDKAAYLAEVTTDAYIKEVIDMAFRAIDPSVLADAAETLFNNYKIQAINKIAKMTEEYVAAIDAEVAAGTLNAEVAERMTKAANKIEIAYINEIFAMNFADYDYVANTVKESKQKVYDHFAGIVGTIDPRDADVTELTPDDGGAYKAVVDAITTTVVTDIADYATEQAAKAGSVIDSCN